MTTSDRDILRSLAGRIAEVAALPIQQETAAEWRRLNRLESGRPLVWINEIPWHEMDVDDALAARCEDPGCQGLERGFRMTLYQWEHMPGDMTVEPVVYSPLAYLDSGVGISEQADYVHTDERNAVVSRGFHQQIQSEADLDKIRMPTIEPKPAATQEAFARMSDLFGDILTVEKRGVAGMWFAPWDELIRWWGVEQAMMDLVLKPELVHAAMERLVSGYLHRLDQLEEHNLLSLNTRNDRVGSGGYGYTDELPPEGADLGCLRPSDLWGCATAQIFSEVSPEMHEEFALQYERRWLERWGMTYYGCCEPLDIKMGILRSIPNLRKVSMSAWIDVDRAVEEVGDRYVFSYKPNPAYFAESAWRPEAMRAELRYVLDRTRGCRVEIIMKDVSTVRYQPQRLWEWARIAKEEAAECRES